MAGDQRYCIECGERRGESRLSSLEQAAATQPGAATAATPAGYAPPPAANTRRSSGIALLATIALLLLAMGVGVLIGNNGDSKNGTAQQPIVYGAAPTAAAGATTATAAADAGKTDNSGGSDASGSDASALAKKNHVKLAKPDVKLGDKCEKGAAGCNGGKFDGGFFGGE